MTDESWRILTRKVLPWTGFFLAVAALKFFWPLIFLTYIVGSLMSGAVSRMQRATGASRRRAVLLSYFTLVCLISAAVMLLVPQAWREGIEFGKTRVVEFRGQLETFIQQNVPKENVAKITENVKQKVEELSPAAVLSDAAFVVQAVGRGFLFAFLSIIFSCLVLFDPAPLLAGLENIRKSRIGFIYEEIAPPVAEFFRILGKVFDAQIVIAMLNTTLTLLGMYFLGIPGELFLAVIVFFCGLLPVVGAFLSSVPIVITALVQPAGFWLALKAIVMIMLVHALEAYVLNPRIMGDHLKMHPLSVIITLLVGEHFFGMWGVVMGVPIITYLAHWFAGSAEAAEAAGAPLPPPLLTPPAPGPAPMAVEHGPGRDRRRRPRH